MTQRSVQAQNTRARALGIPFDGTPGTANAITDVDSVYVGHETVTPSDEPTINTGVTAILPCGNASIDTTKTPRQNIGNGIDSFVLAAWCALNGCGEMTGTTWIEESGFLEGPIMLTNTCSVGTVRDAVIQYALNQVLPTAKNDPSQVVDPDYGFSLMLPIVAETYDGWLNNILTPRVDYQAVAAAFDNAKQYTDATQVDEGNVGGGTGMTCYDWKGGIGTASRTNIQIYVYDQNSPPNYILLTDPTKPKNFKGYTVGVLAWIPILKKKPNRMLNFLRVFG
jgi:D-aminopeptidase